VCCLPQPVGPTTARTPGCSSLRKAVILAAAAMTSDGLRSRVTLSFRRPAAPGLLERASARASGNRRYDEKGATPAELASGFAADGAPYGKATGGARLAGGRVGPCDHGRALLPGGLQGWSASSTGRLRKAQILGPFDVHSGEATAARQAGGHAAAAPCQRSWRAAMPRSGVAADTRAGASTRSSLRAGSERSRGLR